MSEGDNFQSSPEHGTRQAWSEVWLKAITRPSVATYETLVSMPDLSTGTAYAWVFVGALVGYIFAFLIGSVFGGFAGFGQPEAIIPYGGSGFSILLLVCVGPLVSLLSVLGLMISAGITQFIATALGGTGTYGKLVYAYAAYLAPLSVIASIVGAIPVVNCLTIPLGIYGLVLNVTAVKAVNEFGWGRAIASSFLILASILVIIAVVVIVVLALLGPAIGNIFENILEGIVTPAP